MKNTVIIILIFISQILVSQKLHLEQYTESPIGYHYLYHPTHNHLPVFNQWVKINTIHDNQYEYYTHNTNFTPINIEKPYQIIKNTEGYLLQFGNYIKVNQQQVLCDNGKAFTIYKDEFNTIIHSTADFLNIKDSVGFGNVFMPDPLTSSQQVYSGNYIDNADATNPSLDQELYNVQLELFFENDTFFLENEHVKITNHSSPDIQPQKSTQNNFNFNRSQNGFEEVNAIYHITRFAHYFKDTLGFSNLVSYQIPVDVYALGNADASEFIRTTNPPRLNFGTGGVDDAEDADVIIHEYTHALSNSAAPATLSGSERFALEEGIADYFAAAYSKDIDDFNYKNIFSWDGHNEFWNGRTLNHNKNYLTDLTNNRYSDGEIFAAYLMEIRNQIPDTTADKIFIQSIYSWFPEMTFKDAHNLILQADTALNNSSNSQIIQAVGCSRGLSSPNCTNSISNQFNITEIWINSSLVKSNQLDFVGMPLNSFIRIYTSNGKLLQQYQYNGQPIYLDNGFYVVKFHHQKHQGALKTIITGE